METDQISRRNQIHEYITDLRKYGKFITNLFNFEKIECEINHGKIFFEYEKGGYLNLLCEDDGFYRLYFCIIDLDHYQFRGIGKKVVCDVFVTCEDNIFDKIVEKLGCFGFVQYGCVEKWVRSTSDKFTGTPLAGYVFDQAKKREVVDMLFGIFDKYIDNLPRECEIDTFLYDKKFINVYESKGHEYIGSAIYSEKKNRTTLEFYFVREEKRGKRLSYLLHNYLYQLIQKKEYKFISYINSKNLLSIAVHQRYGYQKDKLKKYTFINFMSNHAGMDI